MKKLCEETRKQNEEIGKQLAEKLDEEIELMRGDLQGQIHQVGTELQRQSEKL